MIHAATSVDLAFEAVGSGPPVVILHGMFGSGRNWTRIAQMLGDTCRVYLPDARNRGASPWNPSMAYADMALDVLAFIEREGLQRPALIGHSMGGKTAMTLALQCPEAISGLAVIDIAPERYADGFSSYAAAMRGLDLAVATSRQEVRQALVRSLSCDAPIDFLMQNLQHHGERFEWRLNAQALLACMPGLCDFPAQPVPVAYDGPALFVAGGESDYVRPAAHADIARLFPRARLETVADAGHWVHADRPDALLLALRRWLIEADACRDTAPHPVSAAT